MATPNEQWTNPAAFRLAIINAMIKVIDNESSYIRRYSRYGAISGTVGCALLAIATYGSLKHLDSQFVPWLVITGSVGGLSIGLAMYFINAARQWPVIREFIDVEAMKNAVTPD